MFLALCKEVSLIKGQEVVKEYRFRGMKGGALFGFFIGLIVVFQSLEPGAADIQKILIWTAATTIFFALVGLLLFGGSAGVLGYDDSSDSSSDSGGSGSDGGSGGE